MLPDNYEVHVCDDRSNEFYGETVQVISGTWNGHLIYVEKVNDTFFFRVDNEFMQVYKSYDYMEQYIKEKTS